MGAGSYGLLGWATPRDVWTPGLSPLLGWCGVALALACLVFASRSVVWWKTTGPVCESERAWFRAPTGGSKLLLAALTAAGVLYPFGLAAGVLLLLFQVSPSTTVVLVSRENRSTAVTPEWRSATAGAGERGRTIDAGRVVDRALQLFAARYTGAATATDASALAAARQAVLDAVREAARDGFAGATVPSADKVSFGSSVREQSWVVESIELAVLRLIAESANTELTVVLTGGRRDAAGTPTWQHASDYLRPAARFLGRTDVRVVDGAPSGRLRLVGAEELKADQAGSREVLLTFHSPATPGGGTESVQISPGARLAVRRSARNDLVRAVVDLPATADRVKAENLGTGAIDVVTVSSFAGGWTTKRIRVLGPPSWQRTVEQINSPPAAPTDRTAGWWLRLAHNRLFVNGLLPAGAALTFGGSAEPGDLVIDGTVGGGILMYCASSDPPPAPPTVRAPVVPSGLLAVWTPRDGTDRVFGLGNLELPPAGLSAADRPSQVGEAFVSDIRALPLRNGRPPRRPRDDLPLLTVAPDPRQPQARAIVWLSARPEELKLTAPDSGGRWTDEMRASAFWAGVIDAAQFCAHPATAAPGPPDDGQRPVVLLSAADIQREAARRYATGAAVLAASLAAASIWSLFQLYVRRK